MKSLFTALALALAASAAFADLPTPATPARPPLASLLALTDKAATTLYADACCKRCSKGKACGDSCISRSKTCHKGQGCACD